PSTLPLHDALPILLDVGQRQPVGVAAGREDHPRDPADRPLARLELRNVLGFDRAPLDFGSDPPRFGSSPLGFGSFLFGTRGISESDLCEAFLLRLLAGGFGSDPPRFGGGPLRFRGPPLRFGRGRAAFGDGLGRARRSLRS